MPGVTKFLIFDSDMMYLVSTKIFCASLDMRDEMIVGFIDAALVKAKLTTCR